MNNSSKYTLIAAFSLLLMIFSCKKDQEKTVEVPESPKPLADFTYKLVSTEDPFTFKFENNSKDFKEVRWEFGDDSTSTEVSPTHTFIMTGDYRIKVTARNDQNYWAQKETTIKLRPDSVMSFGSTTAADGKITLGLNGPVKVASVSWYKVVSNVFKLIETAPTTTVVVPTGTYETYSATITTPKGSKAELIRQVGSAGVLKDATLNGGFSVSRDNDSGPASTEGSLKMIDNNIRSNFVQFNFKGDFWAQLDFKDQPQVLSGYSLTSGAEALERDPKNFSMEGSDDKLTWTVLDKHVGEIFLTRLLTKTYIFQNTTPYRYYRLNVTANNGAGLLQIAEWRTLVMQ